MEGLKNSDEDINKKIMDSLKKPYFINHGDSGASGSGTKPSQPPLPFDLLTTVSDDNNNKTTTNQQNPSRLADDHHKMMIPSSSGGTGTGGADTRWTRKPDHELDPEKLRRAISNRAYAQKYRKKKQLYVTDMEREAQALEAQIAMMGPQVSLFRDQQEFLLMEHHSLTRRMTTYNNNDIFINAEIEAKKAEIARLMQEEQKKMQH